MSRKLTNSQIKKLIQQRLTDVSETVREIGDRRRRGYQERNRRRLERERALRVDTKNKISGD